MAKRSVGDKVAIYTKSSAWVGTIVEIYGDGSFSVESNGDVARFTKYGQQYGKQNYSAPKILSVPGMAAEELVAEYYERRNKNS